MDLMGVSGTIGLLEGHGWGNRFRVSDKESAVSSQAVRPLRVLFVCAKNQWRSPTAEQLYRRDPRLEVRSAGIRAEARRRVTAADLEWADLVMVMEQEQRSWIGRKFRDCILPRIEVLDVPDDYGFMDVRLQEVLRSVIAPVIDGMLSEGVD